MVMQRTSTISENAEPTTTIANAAKPPTGFQSQSTCAAFGCTMARYRLDATTDDTTVASTPQVKMTWDARDRSAENRASETGSPRPARYVTKRTEVNSADALPKSDLVSPWATISENSIPPSACTAAPMTRTPEPV